MRLTVRHNTYDIRLVKEFHALYGNRPFITVFPTVPFIELSYLHIYRGADKSLARPTSLRTLFDGKNISFDASLVIYIYTYI